MLTSYFKCGFLDFFAEMELLFGRLAQEPLIRLSNIQFIIQGKLFSLKAFWLRNDSFENHATSGVD